VEFTPKDNWQGRIRQYIPAKVADALGEPFFSTVVAVEFRASSDEDLRKCLEFRHVERVVIYGLTDGENSVSAEGLRQLQALPRLREVDLEFDPVSSPQLRAVIGITTLESLTVTIAEGNDSLRSLAQMRHLTDLSVFLEASNDLGNIRVPPGLMQLNCNRSQGGVLNREKNDLDLKQGFMPKHMAWTWSSRKN
jgi:hypothetical protein